MSSKGGQNTIEKDSTPWVGQQGYLSDIFRQAQAQYYDHNTPSYFPGSTVANLDPATLAAQQSLLQGAQNAQQTADVSRQALAFNMTDARDVESNPYLQSAIRAAIRPMQENFTDVGGTIYNIGDQALQAGQWGGTRQGVAEGIALSRLNQQVGDVAASMASQGYETGLDASTRALAISPQISAQQFTPAQGLDAVGQQQRQYAQELLDDEIARWNFDQNLPSQKLANYQQVVQGGYGGQSTTTSPAARVSPLMSAAGGALSGAAVGASTGASGGGYWGAAIGAMIGLMGAYV